MVNTSSPQRQGDSPEYLACCRLQELEKQLSLADSKLQAQRAWLGGVNATAEIDQQVQRQIKVLESRLDKALVKFNEALSQNKSLREEIDHLRRERVTFETIYKKLEKELHDKKKEMVNVIEISNIAYEARDQAQNEIAALRAQVLPPTLLPQWLLRCSQTKNRLQMSMFFWVFPDDFAYCDWL